MSKCQYYAKGPPEYYDEGQICFKRAIYRVHFDSSIGNGARVRVVKVICTEHICGYKNLPASCFVEFIDPRLNVMT